MLLRPIEPPPGFPLPPRHIQLTTKAVGSVLWFWILYRAKQDGTKILVRKCTFMYLS